MLRDIQGHAVLFWAVALILKGKSLLSRQQALRRAVYHHPLRGCCLTEDTTLMSVPHKTLFRQRITSLPPCVPTQPAPSASFHQASQLKFQRATSDTGMQYLKALLVVDNSYLEWLSESEKLFLLLQPLLSRRRCHDHTVLVCDLSTCGGTLIPLHSDEGFASLENEIRSAWMQLCEQIA
jgi:hypothetical protein